MSNYAQRNLTKQVTPITKHNKPIQKKKENLTSKPNSQIYYEILHKEIIPEFCRACTHPIITHVMP